MSLYTNFAIRKGAILVANPLIRDPAFKESVVLIDSEPHYPITGIIINKGGKTLETSGTTPEKNRYFKKLQESYDGHIGFGGPAMLDTVFVISATKDQQNSENLETELFDIRSDSRRQKFISEMNELKMPVRVFCGIGMWSADLLEYEINQGCWAVVPYDPEVVFGENPEENLYETLLAKASFISPNVSRDGSNHFTL